MRDALWKNVPHIIALIPLITVNLTCIYMYIWLVFIDIKYKLRPLKQPGRDNQGVRPGYPGNHN